MRPSARGPSRKPDDQTRDATDYKEEKGTYVEPDNLSEAELARVSNYKRRNKNRETLLEQIEHCARRIRVQR